MKVFNSSEKFTHQKNILFDCLDWFVGVPFIMTDKDEFNLSTNIIGTLKTYPGVQDNTQITEIGAYLYVLNARNYLNIARCGFISYKDGFKMAQKAIETALDILTDSKV